MKLLRERQAQEDTALLDAAWSAPETFVLLPEKLGVTDEWLAAAGACLPAALRADHFAMLTSGTTGKPKLVLGNRVRSERLAAVLHEKQDSAAVAETILLLPLSYTYAFVNQWLWARTQGRRLIATDGLSDPAALGTTFSSAKNAMLCLVGVQVPLLLIHLAGKEFPGVIRIHFAGGRFPQERLSDLRGLFPNAAIFNNYGCAEAMPRLTLRRADEADDAANIGRPLPGVELQSGADHALKFRSPYGAVGVVEDGCFAAIAPGDWTPTGDLGEPLADGSWRLLGRASEVFKRHGEKVSLHALTTTVTAAWPGQCAFYRERDVSGEDGCVLTLAPTADAAALREVQLALRRHHPRAQWPLRIEAVDSLPLLSNGKPDVRSLAIMPGKSILWHQHI